MANVTLHKDIHIKTSGELPTKGEKVKEFSLLNKDLSEVKLSDYSENTVILNIFPSVDTPVCAVAAKKFNEMASQKENTKVVNVSYDLPFALGRFCAAEGIDNVDTLSAFRSNFGEDYGTLMIDGPLKGLNARAVIVLNSNREVVHAELVGEIADEPNYEMALAAIA